jgi:hypothetical protein
VWDGHIECDGTAILAAQPYAFDSAAEGLTEITPRRVAWKSVTTGDSDGVILTLDPADQGTLQFTSPLFDFTLSLRALGSEPVVHDAGGLGLRVTVEREPQALGKDVTAELRDTILPEGVTPYHARVLQSDGAKAWASPIWVHSAPPRA